MTVCVLDRTAIISQDGFEGERVRFCNSSPALSENDIPNLSAPITPQIGSFNSWAKMTYKSTDGQETHLKKDDAVVIEDQHGDIIATGTVMSLRDHAVWIAKEDGVDIHYPQHETIRPLNTVPKL